MGIVILETKHQLIKDAIVDKTSRLIKQNDEPDKSGMTEVPTHMLKELDNLLYELSVIEMEISQYKIDKP